MPSFHYRRLSAVIDVVIACATTLGCGTTSTGDAGLDANAGIDGDVCDPHGGSYNCSLCPGSSIVHAEAVVPCEASDASVDVDGSPPFFCAVDCSPCQAAIEANAGLAPVSYCSSVWKLGVQGVGSCVCTELSQSASGMVTVACSATSVCGRRLDGVVEPRIVGATQMGRLFAECAWLEGVSVYAFRRLARELSHHRAPRRLVVAARAAARDEARHARIMATLVRRHGAAMPKIVIERSEPRSLEVVATENAIEACVQETYGALVAAWQATSAEDADVRRAFESIAPDELRHAALGWEVAAWARRRLSAEANSRIHAARTKAIEQLTASVRPEPPASIVTAGMPSSARARHMLDQLHTTMWS